MKRQIFSYLGVATISIAMLSCKNDKETIDNVNSITITTQPTKKIYNINEIFDPAGLVINATYDDGSIKNVSAPNSDLTYEYNFSSSSTIAWDKTVTVTYKKQPTQFAVTVSPPEVTFNDGRGNNIVIPYGALSCAMKVISFVAGNPWTSDPLDMDPNLILGIPDRGNLTNGKAITLGADGVIVVEMGVWFTDGEGLDIYVFEVGNDVEATKVEVSADLENWIYVGDASGSLSGVDMNGKVPAGSKYKYIRLTDLRTAPTGSWPGADIDAVCILYPVLK